MNIKFIHYAVMLLLASGTFATNPEPDTTTTTTETTSTSATSTPSSTSLAPTTTSSSLAPTTTSSPAPTTTSSSAAPTTTTSPAPTTTTSPAPITTSPAPTTTSPAPTTTSTPTPETTTSHETTSVAPTSSTGTPVTTTTPIPVPEPGYWNVTEGNTTCIRANLAIRFKIEINGVVDYIVLSPTASSEGSKCNTSDGTEVLLLKDSEYNVIFVFEKSSDNVYVRNISFTYYIPASTGQFFNDSHFFEVKAGNSYLCKTSSDVILGNATMEMISVHVQAFGGEHNKDFGAAEECGADNPINDIVPIAVGVALLVLVVVVLIAYLVGRRRSRQKGYQSV